MKEILSHLLADAEARSLVKARSHCTLNAHSIRFNAHWFAFKLSRRECALSQSGLKPVWLNPLREVVFESGLKWIGL